MDKLKYAQYLSISDMCTSIVYLISLHYCNINRLRTVDVAQAFLGIYFPCTMLVWTSCIGYFIYKSIMQSNNGNVKLNIQKHFRLYHVISWTTPIVFSIGPLILILKLKKNNTEFSSSMTTGGWCWVDHWYYQLLGGKCIEVVSLTCTMYFYVNSYILLKRQQQQQKSLDQQLNEQWNKSGQPFLKDHHYLPTSNNSSQTKKKKKKVSDKCVVDNDDDEDNEDDNDDKNANAPSNWYPNDDRNNNKDTRKFKRTRRALQICCTFR
ncbi:putative G-protein coupled receptor [Reticulomyxa filosa]|uniref:Putative G-protein coupled receptor n=1 Tax=Reticulomyxa filosa TaxID=46433 RepID=X6NM15_RETFI|nr:putative G-protein coupled receptor [Reticulomyxa filosa]|eukprot:ETO26948.1 putative G-protein coupled receptor [Reticulomyxa filosa]